MSLILQVSPHPLYKHIFLSGKGLHESDFNELIETVDSTINNESPYFLVDLKEMELINSTGLNALIKIFTKARNAGGELYIVNISDKINQVFILTKLNSVLNIATSIQEVEEIFKEINNTAK